MKKQNDLLENHFEFDKGVKLMSALRAFMQPADKPLPEEEAIRKQFGVMDPANVTMVVAKSVRARRILRYFLDKEDKQKKIPCLDYATTEIASCKYSFEYLTKILSLFFDDEESPKLSLKKNYPLTIENSDFAVLLAPRVSQDDKGDKNEA